MTNLAERMAGAMAARERLWLRSWIGAMEPRNPLTHRKPADLARYMAAARKGWRTRKLMAKARRDGRETSGKTVEPKR